MPKLTFKLCHQDSAGCASLDTDKCCVRGCYEQRRFRTRSLRPLMSALGVFAGLARSCCFANTCSETGEGNKLGHPILFFLLSSSWRVFERSWYPRICAVPTKSIYAPHSPPRRVHTLIAHACEYVDTSNLGGTFSPRHPMLPRSSKLEQPC